MASREELEAWSDRWLKANQEAEKAGMNAYVTKPIEPEKLYQALAQ